MKSDQSQLMDDIYSLIELGESISIKIHAHTMKLREEYTKMVRFLTIASLAFFLLLVPYFAIRFEQKYNLDFTATLIIISAFISITLYTYSRYTEFRNSQRVTRQLLKLDRNDLLTVMDMIHSMYSALSKDEIDIVRLTIMEIKIKRLKLDPY